MCEVENAGRLDRFPVLSGRSPGPWRRAWLVLFLGLAIFGNVIFAEPGRAGSALIPSPPRFQFSVNLLEFSVLNSSAVSAVSRYGGEVDFDVKMSRNPKGDVVWNVTVENPRLIKAWSHWVAEKSLELIKSLNADSLNQEGKQALRTIQSLSSKLEQADAQPLWDTVRVAGRWLDSAQALYLETGGSAYRLTGEGASIPGQLETHDVVVIGFLKVAGEIEVVGAISRKLNTLELFTMSHCPYGQAALGRILGALASDSGSNKPELKVRFIFYRDETTGAYSSLHGEAETQENLAQMLLRDRFSDSYQPYLLRRLQDTATPWDSLARQSGLTEAEVEEIASTLEAKRAELIQTEYEYVAGVCGILDGSPSYQWESERVTDLREIESLKSLAASLERCAKAD